MWNKLEGKIVRGFAVLLLLVLASVATGWLAVFLPVLIAASDPVAGTNKGPIDAETLFTASATIMVLSVFGSILGIRMRSKPKKPNLGWQASASTAAPIATLIIIQFLFMGLLAFGINIYTEPLWRSPLSWWICGTALCFMATSFFVFVSNHYSSD